MAKAKAAVSWSGGKDSCLALHRARQEFAIGAIITMFTEDGARSRSHGLRPEVLQRQAELLGLELVCGRSWQTYEANFKVLLESRRTRGYTHVIFGDILLAEHRLWAERVCNEVGLTALEPLWGESTAKLVREFLTIGGQAYIVATKAALLDSTWLGRQLDLATISLLEKLGIDSCGEYGEYHTLAVGLKIRQSGHLLHGGYLMLDLLVA